MFLLNINENKWYIDGFEEAKFVINNMFKEYFSELYQENALKWRIDEIWKKVSVKIPQKALVFVEKDSIFYALNSSLKFEVVPEDFFEIDEDSHPILVECFEDCHLRFKNKMKNYREWDTIVDKNLVKTASIANVYLNKSISYYNIETLSSTLYNAKCQFEKTLQISLKQKIYDQVCTEILKAYESALLQSDPIMLITTTEEIRMGLLIQKTYAITENLEVEEVEYSLIERELEEIIKKVVPEDTDFLVNRIYNFLMLPLISVRPCIRIKKVENSGLNAIIFLEEKNIPVVCDFEMKKFYTFLKSKRNIKKFPTSKRIKYYNNVYHKNGVETTCMPPNTGIELIQTVNKRMFDDIICYAEKIGEVYLIYDEDTGKCDKSQNILYKLNKGTVEKVYGVTKLDKRRSSYKNYESTMKKEASNIEKQGIYSFWEITFADTFTDD